MRGADARAAGTPGSEPWFIRQIRGDGTGNVIGNSDDTATAKPEPPRSIADTGAYQASYQTAAADVDADEDSEQLLRASDAVRTPISAPPPAYRRPRNLGWWPFALAGVLAAMVALALWLTAPTPVKEAGTIPPAAGPMPRAVAAPRAAAPVQARTAAVAPAPEAMAPAPATAVAAAPAAVAPSPAPVAVADPNAALQCARPETIDRLRKLVAAKARAQGGGARSDRLAELISLSVTGTPDAAGGDNPAYRCSGWLSLAAAGAGVAEPVSVTYRVERTSDGRSLVSIVEGTNPIVAAIVGAAKRVDPAAMLAGAEATRARSSSPKSSGRTSSAKPASARSSPAEPSSAKPSSPVESSVIARKTVLSDDTASRFSNPSFDCRAAESPVDRMICDSGALAALDRQTAALFDKVRHRADPRVREALENSHVDFRNRQQRCSTKACVTRVYQERIADLGDYR